MLTKAAFFFYNKKYNK